MTRIAIFASGRGSNFDSIQTAIQTGKLDAQIVALICDQPGAPVLEKARGAGVPPLLIEVNRALPANERRGEHEARILAALAPLDVRFLVMAGYMRVLTPRLIDAFRSERGYSRIVNIHPSLLPSFAGLSGYAQAFEHGVKVTGATVHLVEHEVDSGPICAQESFSIEDCVDVASVEKRGLAIEHRLFPETLKWVLPEQFSYRPLNFSLPKDSTIRGSRVCKN